MEIGEKEVIYLDYSATTPVLPEIMNTYQKVTKEYIGNPNSLHDLGIKAKELMDCAVGQMADLLKIKTNEIILTSGATEANNLAIIGTVLAKGKKVVE